LLNFIAIITFEYLSFAIVSAIDYVFKSHIFRSFIHSDDSNFEYNMKADLYDIVS